MNRISYEQIFRKLIGLWLPMAFATTILIAAIGILLKCTEIDFKNNAVKTTALVAGYTKYGYPVLSYSVDGKEHLVRSRSLIPGSRVGSAVEIEYHGKNPENISYGENPLYGISVFLIIIGTIGAAVLAYFLFMKH